MSCVWRERTADDYGEDFRYSADVSMYGGGKGRTVMFDVYDEPNGAFLGRFHVSGREQLSAEQVELPCDALSDGQKIEKMSIGVLTSLVFGYEDIEQLKFSKEFKEEWRKIKPLCKVFLNEIV